MYDFFYFGWGTWDRTKECRSQRPMPYRLAIPQLVSKSNFHNTRNFFLKNNFDEFFDVAISV